MVSDNVFEFPMIHDYLLEDTNRSDLTVVNYDQYILMLKYK